MSTLRKAREAGSLEIFIMKREAEGDAPGDADRLTATVRRLVETPKADRPASKRAHPAD